MQLAILPMVAALGLCVWGLLEPFAGLLGLLIFNVAQPEQVFTVLGTLHVEKVAGILIVGSFLLRSHRMRITPIGGWLLAFFAAVVASIPLAFWWSNALDSAADFAKTVVLAFLVINVINTRGRLRTFLLIYALLLGYLAVSGLVNFYSGSFYFDGQTDRLIGITNDSNAPDTLALTLVATLPMLAVFFTRGNRLWRPVMLGLGAACVWGMVLTGSRTGLYTFIVLLAAYALRSRRRWVIVPGAVLAVILLWAALPQQYRLRYSSTLSAQGRDRDPAYQTRLLSWDGGWHMFLHNPLTGIGVGDYLAANGAQYWPDPDHKIYLDAHSIVFKLLGELGLFGFVTFFGMVAVLVRNNFRLRRQLAALGEKSWLLAYPRAANFTIFVLLFAGYASHDVYRSTWYLLAGITASLDLLLQSEAAAPLALPAALQPGEAAQAVAP